MRVRPLVRASTIACVAACVAGVMLWWLGSNRGAGDGGAAKSARAPASPAPSRSAAPPHEAARNVESAPEPAAPAGLPARASDSVEEAACVVLHVVDRDSRAELGDVKVFEDEMQISGFGHDDPWPDALGAPLLDHAASPVRIESRRLHRPAHPAAALWVRARGWSWAHANVGFPGPADVTVELVPAGDLLVELRGRLPDESRGRARIRLHDPAVPWLSERGTRDDLRRPFGRPVVSSAAKLGVTEFEGLRPRRLVVSVELGDGFECPLVLAHQSVELVARSTAQVTLVLEDPAPVERVPLSGDLFVPATWPVAKWASCSDDETPEEEKLTIRPIDLAGATEADEQAIALSEMTPVEGRPGWFRWRAKPVLPARYAVSLVAAGFARGIEVPRGGRNDVEIVLRDAAILRVRVVEEHDGSAAGVEGLLWRSSSDEDSEHLIGWIALAHRSVPGEFESPVPVGRGELMTASVEWRLDPATTSFYLQPGEREVMVTASRLLRITVKLECGGEPVPWPWALACETRIEPVGHAGSVGSISSATSAVTLGVSAPGRYRITLPPLPNFKEVAPFEVDLAADAVLERVVELARR